MFGTSWHPVYSLTSSSIARAWRWRAIGMSLRKSERLYIAPPGERESRGRSLTWLGRSTIVAPPVSVRPSCHAHRFQSATAPGASDTCCAFVSGRRARARALAMLTFLSAARSFRSFPPPNFARSGIASARPLDSAAEHARARSRAHAPASAPRDRSHGDVTARQSPPGRKAFDLLPRDRGARRGAARRVNEDTVNARGTSFPRREDPLEAIIAPPDDKLRSSARAGPEHARDLYGVNDCSGHGTDNSQDYLNEETSILPVPAPLSLTQPH